MKVVVSWTTHRASDPCGAVLLLLQQSSRRSPDNLHAHTEGRAGAHWVVFYSWSLHHRIAHVFDKEKNLLLSSSASPSIPHTTTTQTRPNPTQPNPIAGPPTNQPRHHHHTTTTLQINVFFAFLFQCLQRVAPVFSGCALSRAALHEAVCDTFQDSAQPCAVG